MTPDPISPEKWRRLEEVANRVLPEIKRATDDGLPVGIPHMTPQGVLITRMSPRCVMVQCLTMEKKEER